MENKETMEAKKKKAQRLTALAITGMAVLVIGYAVYAIATKHVNMILFEILLGCFVIGYLLLTDVMEPWKTGLLKDLTPRRKTAYGKLLGLDVIGAGALLYWVAGMNSESGSSILIPVLIYFLANQMKRKIRPEFEVLDEELEAKQDAENQDKES